MTSIEGHIRLGLLAEYVPGSLVLRMLPAFRHTYPQIRFTVMSGTIAAIEEGLIAETLTFGVIDRPESHDFLNAIRCGVVEYVAVASRSYVEARGPFDKVESVLGADLIDVAPNMPQVSRWIGTEDPSLVQILGQASPAFVVPNFPAAMEIVVAGIGVAVLPEPLVAAALASGQLVTVCPDRPPPPKPLQFIYRKRRFRPLVESVFMEYFLEQPPLRA